MVLDCRIAMLVNSLQCVAALVDNIIYFSNPLSWFWMFVLLQTEYARFENGRFVYRIHRSPMCDYMITFIHKLKQLPEKYMMNSVLENFTILQVWLDKTQQQYPTGRKISLSLKFLLFIKSRENFHSLQYRLL
mgnify:CR=1 FL=1